MCGMVRAYGGGGARMRIWGMGVCSDVACRVAIKNHRIAIKNNRIALPKSRVAIQKLPRAPNTARISSVAPFMRVLHAPYSPTPPTAKKGDAAKPHHPSYPESPSA